MDKDSNYALNPEAISSGVLQKVSIGMGVLGAAVCAAGLASSMPTVPALGAMLSTFGALNYIVAKFNAPTVDAPDFDEAKALINAYPESASPEFSKHSLIS